MNIKESRTTVSHSSGFDVNVEIMLTTFCNLNCEYCCKRIGKIPAENRTQISLATFEEVVEKLFATNKHLKYRITLIGGEISLHPDLENMIKILARHQEQIPQLYLMFNGILDFKKYVDAFPAEQTIVTVSIHTRMLTDDQIDTVIRNINNSNKNLESYWIDIMVDPEVSKNPVHWDNFAKRIVQETSIERVTLIPLSGVEFDEKMTEYAYSLDKDKKCDDYIITDTDGNVTRASKSDITSSGRISFMGLYCYSYNVSWQIETNGDISRHCSATGNLVEDRYELSRYDEFFASLTTATPCPLARCGCANRTRTKKTIDKQDVEAYYRTKFKK